MKGCRVVVGNKVHYMLHSWARITNVSDDHMRGVDLGESWI